MIKLEHVSKAYSAGIPALNDVNLEIDDGEPKLPQTGDNANPLLYLGIGALALITGVGVGLRGRKKKNKQ